MIDLECRVQDLPRDSWPEVMQLVGDRFDELCFNLVTVEYSKEPLDLDTAADHLYAGPIGFPEHSKLITILGEQVAELAHDMAELLNRRPNSAFKPVKLPMAGTGCIACHTKGHGLRCTLSYNGLKQQHQMSVDCFVGQHQLKGD